MNTFNNAARWFEIPAKDIARAKKFYEAIFETKLQELTLANNLKMALFPVEKGTVGAALCEHKDFYHPGHQGPLVYLNADPDLKNVLDRVIASGGRTLMPKTQISPEFGFMALFEDCEGNRIALHSSK